MLFRTYRLAAPLSALVDDFWLYEGYVGRHSRELILPSGTFEMVFNLAEDALRIYDAADPSRCRQVSGAVVSGPYAGSFVSDTVEESALLGVHFRPGGASAVLGLPAGELANTHVDLRDLWGPDATGLRERLCALDAPIARFRLLERALLRRLTGIPARHGAVRIGLGALIRTHGRMRVRDIARAADLSTRRFGEVFTAEVGLTPKLFGRVLRFQNAAALARDLTHDDWAELALEVGCFDQSHLIQEFVAFSGRTPAAFLSRLNALDRAGAHVKRHHLPLPD